jgi:hypothetical protein
MSDPSGYNSPYKDDPEEEDLNTSSLSVNSSNSRPSSTARHIELTQRTNELLSNFGNFLNELGGDGEFGASTALQSPRSNGNNGTSTVPTDNLSPLRSRNSSYRDDDVSYEPTDQQQTNLWNTGYHDYDADRKKLYRYRLFGGNNIAYVCTFGVIIALVVIAGVSLGGKHKEKAPPTTATVTSGTSTLEKEEEEVKDLLSNLDMSYMPQDPQLKELYLVVAETFRPRWFNRQNGWEGQAYLQAYDFCHSQNEMQPCPYLAICPAGVGYPPFGGVKASPKDQGVASWAPVKNVPNEWVQISYSPEGDNEDGDICELFTSSHNGTPRWGLTGEYDEALTENILCCRVDEEVMNEAPEAFTNVVNEMLGQEQKEEEDEETSGMIDRPPSLEEDESDVGQSLSTDETVNMGGEEDSEESRTPEIPAFWFSRLDGWEGTTYQSAKDFCSAQNGKSICPFQLYCPDGPGGVPFAASAQQALLEYDSLFWSPVLNGIGQEAWAGIGSANRCVPPLEYPRVSPEMLYNATSFIMCCDMNDDSKKGEQSSTSTTVEETVGSTAAAEAVQQVDDFSESEFVKAAKEIWNPQWFTTEEGWSGGSYADAISFCQLHFKDGELCPYQGKCHYYIPCFHSVKHFKLPG